MSFLHIAFGEAIISPPTFKEKGTKHHLLIGEWKFLEGFMRLEILLQPSLEHATYLRYIIPFVLNHLSLFVLCEAQCIPHGSAQTLLTSTVSPMCLIDSSTVSHYTMSCNYLFVSALPGRRSTSQEPVRQALSVGSLSAITSMPRCR